MYQYLPFSMFRGLFSSLFSNTRQWPMQGLTWECTSTPCQCSLMTHGRVDIGVNDHTFKDFNKDPCEGRNGRGRTLPQFVRYLPNEGLTWVWTNTVSNSLLPFYLRVQSISIKGRTACREERINQARQSKNIKIVTIELQGERWEQNSQV